jgi:shikimate kinase
VLLWVGLADGLRRTGMSTARPLLAGVNPRATFKALLDARAPLYREVATVEVETSRRSPNQVARAVLAAVAQAHPEVVPPQVLAAAVADATPPHGTPQTAARSGPRPGNPAPGSPGGPDPGAAPTPVAGVPLPDPLVRPRP